MSETELKAAKGTASPRLAPGTRLRTRPDDQLPANVSRSWRRTLGDAEWFLVGYDDTACAVVREWGGYGGWEFIDIPVLEIFEVVRPPAPWEGASARSEVVAEACHRDTCTKEQWAALVAELPPIVATKAANWLAHGAACFRIEEGIACTRRDWMNEGVWRLLASDGSESFRPLPIRGPGLGDGD